MTLFLASVRDPDEAKTALASGADIIDLKEPASGALGAVDRRTIIETVRTVDGRAPVSATVGDLAMDESVVVEAVMATAACGVDYVKLGLFAAGDPLACLRALRTRTSSLQLIVVAFADRPLPFDVVAAAADAGAKGVMLDTADKASAPLPDLLGEGPLSAFLDGARKRGLVAGLAGALKAAHVQELLRRKPDLLGFRGALCAGGRREGKLDAVACGQIRRLIPAPSDAALASLAERALC